MKQSYKFHVLLLFLFLIFTMRTSARPITTKQGLEKEQLNEITNGKSLAVTEEDDALNPMEVEDCKKGDEECVKRRIVSEAHLDYIYSQKHHHR